MVLDKAIKQKAYSPYFLNAKRRSLEYCVLWILSIFAFVAYFTIDKVPLFYVCVINIFTLLYFFHDFYIIIFIFLEKRMPPQHRVLTLTQIVPERSFADFMQKSNADIFLNENQKMLSRYKLIFKSESGKRVVLRAMMSRKKFGLLFDKMWATSSFSAHVYYAKFSKVIVYYGGEDSIFDILNHIS